MKVAARRRSAAPLGRRRRRLRRRRAGLSDAGRTSRPRRTRRIDANFTKYTPVGRHRRAEARRSAHATRPTTASTTSRDEVIVTAGGKQALYNTAMALFGPGDEVITHTPGWPTLVEQIKLADATPVIVQTHAEDGFAIHAAADPRRDHAADPRHHHQLAVQSDRRADRRSRAGDARRRVARRAGIWIVVDLCYEKLIYDPVAAQPAEGAGRDAAATQR